MTAKRIQFNFYTALILLFIFIFAKNVYVTGVFKSNELGTTSYSSPLKGLSKNTSLITRNSNLFGIYQQQESIDKTEEQSVNIPDVFVDQNKDYIGRLENQEFILYATANFANEVTANLLVKNIESDEVKLLTVNQGDRFDGIAVTNLRLTSVILSTNKNTIELKLFSYGTR